MLDFSNTLLPAPEYWQDFEKLCWSLWKEILSDEDTQMHGRSGQAQNGVDVYGREGGTGDYVGIQCKGKDSRYGHAVTATELREEVKKALDFKPSIGKFILATTAASDKVIQEEARKITHEHEKNGLFSVHVYSWDDIRLRLLEYPDLASRLYSGELLGIDEEANKLKHSRLGNAEVQFEKLESERNASFQNTPSFPSPNSNFASAPKVVADEADHAVLDQFKKSFKAHPEATLTLLDNFARDKKGQLSSAVLFRLKTNTAACYVELGNYAAASENFLAALDHETDQKGKALLNAAHAYHMRGEDEKALGFLDRSIEENPDSADFYPLLITLKCKLDATQNPDDLVPEALEIDQYVAGSLGFAYRDLGDGAKALEWFRKGMEKAPGDTHLSMALGAEILNQVLDRKNTGVDSYFSNEELVLVDEAIAIMANAWSKLTENWQFSRYQDLGINLCNAYRILNNYEQISEIVQTLLSIGCEEPSFIRLAALSTANSGQFEEAIHLLDKSGLELDGETLLLKAELYEKTGKYSVAYELLDQVRSAHPHVFEEKAILLYYFVVLEFLGKDEAVRQASAVVAKEKSSIFELASVSSLFSNIGEEEKAVEAFHKATQLVSEDTTSNNLNSLANAGFDCGQFYKTSTFMQPIIQNYRDQLLLRKYVSCLLRTDQRKRLLEVFGRLDQQTADLSFYRRSKIALLLNSRDYTNAILESKAYLGLFPGDLEVLKNLIGAYHNSEEQGEIEALVSAFEIQQDFEEQTADDLMFMAHTLCRYGRSTDGLKLAYRTLKNNPGERGIVLRYIGLFFGQTVKDEVLSSHQVDDSTCFEVVDGNGNVVNVTPNSDRYIHFHDNSHYELDSELVKQALGKKVGDNFEIQENPFQRKTYEIRNLENKYLKEMILQRELFSKRFPNSPEFVQLDLSDPETEDGITLDPIFQYLERRGDDIELVEEAYSSMRIPLWLFANRIGQNPLKVWRQITAHRGMVVPVCAGSREEIDKSSELLAQQDIRLVPDPLMLYELCRLKLLDRVIDGVGEVIVARSTLDFFLGYVEERETGEPAKSLGRQDGQTWAIEESKEAWEQDIELMRCICDEIKEKCMVLPVLEDFPESMVKFKDIADDAFCDPFILANGVGAVFLTNDFVTAIIAKNIGGIETSWMQILLMKLRSLGSVSENEYANLLLDQVVADYEFVSVDANSLVEILNQYGNEDELRTILKYMGKQNRDIVSSVRVGLIFMVRALGLVEGNEAKQVLVDSVLSGLTSEQGDFQESLVNAIWELFKKADLQELIVLAGYVETWMAQNDIPKLFLSVPNPRPISPEFAEYLFSTTALLSGKLLAKKFE